MIALLFGFPTSGFSTSEALELRAAPLEQALPRIGQALGVPMRASPAIGEEIVVARIDGATPEATKARLVEAFGAQWSTDRDGTLVLMPDSKRREADRRAWHARRRKVTVAWLAGLRRELAHLPEFDAKTATTLVERFDREEEAPNFDADALPTPIRRLFLRLLARLRAEDFETGEPFPRVVFSLTPTELQRGLGVGAGNDLRRYREETALWQLVAPSELDHDPYGAGPAARLLLVAMPDELFTRVTLTLFNAEGWSLESISGSIAFSGDESEADGGRGSRRLPGVPVGWPAPPLAFLEREPLSFAASDAILTLARRNGRSIVAAPSDELLQAEDDWRDRHPGVPDTIPAAWLGRISLDVPGWTRLSPWEPFVARATFFPRTRLRRAAQGFQGGEPPTLAATLRYADLRPEWAFDVPGDDLVKRVIVGGWPFAEVADLRLPAALTPAEWRATAMRPVRFSALSARARGLARKALFGADPQVGHHTARDTPEWDREATGDPARSDPTLSLTSEENPMVQIGIRGRRSLVPIDVFAGLDRYDRTAVQKGEPPEDFELDRSRFFTRTFWTLVLAPRSKSERTLEMEDAPRLLAAGVYARDAIPAALRSRVGLDDR